MPGIEIEGIENALRVLGVAGTLDTIEPAMKRGSLRLEAGMKYYPPKPPRSTYVRTGRYGQGWNTRFSRREDRIENITGNNVRYGPEVGSEEHQAPVHARTGWPTDLDVARREEPEIVRDVEAELRRGLSR